MWKPFEKVRDQLVPGQRVRIMDIISGVEFPDWHIADARVRDDGRVHVVPSRPFVPDYVWVRD